MVFQVFTSFMIFLLQIVPNSRPGPASHRFPTLLQNTNHTATCGTTSNKSKGGNWKYTPTCALSPAPVTTGTSTSSSLWPFQVPQSISLRTAMLNLLSRPPAPACPLAQLHQLRLGKTAQSHVFHRRSKQAWPLDSQSFLNNIYISLATLLAEPQLTATGANPQDKHSLPGFISARGM